MPATARAVTLPKTAKLIPPETIALVDVDDFSKLQTQFEKTSFYKLYKDPAMSPFVDDLKAKWKEKKKEKANNEIPGVLRDLDVWPQGRIAVAFVYDEQAKDANEPPVLFITQWGDQIGKVKEAAAKNVEKAIAEGARREAEDYRGVSITTMTSKSSENLSYCFLDDCLIGSVNPNPLKFVIAHIKGADSPTLGDDDDYNATLRALGSSGAGQLGFYVNIKHIIKIALAEDTDGKAKTLIDNLGLNNVTSFGGTVGLGGGPGGSILGKALLKINGDKKGVCKMLELESAGLRLPRFISASSSSISVVNLNIKKAFAELVNIMTSFSPQMAAMLQMPLAPPSAQGEPPLQLQTGVIDYLGSQIVLAQTIKKASPDAAGSGAEQAHPTAQSLVAIAINNRNALEKSLSLLHSTLIARGNPDAQRQLLGYTIYSIDASGFLPFLGGAGKPGAEPVPSAAFTITDTHLIFASEAAVEQAIRALDTGGETMDSVKWFARAKENIPSAVGVAGLEDSAATAEQVWIMMRESKKVNEGGRSHGEVGMGMSSGSLFPQMSLAQAGSDLVDFSLLPDFDAVRKYFGISTFYGVSRPDGFLFEMKYLAPID
jgi:hypothetical protein